MANTRISILSRGFKKDFNTKLYIPSEFCYANNEKSLFKKYSSLVTTFGNTNIGRDYLGIPNTKEKLDLLIPNGFQLRSGESKEEVERYSVFYSRSVYSRKLLPALSYIDTVSSWINDFEEALKILFWNTGLVKGTIPSFVRSIHLTTSIFNPDPNPETTSVDGYAGRDVAEETFSTLRSSAGNTSGDTNTEMNAGIIRCGTTTDLYDLI